MTKTAKLKPARTIVTIHAHPDDEASKGAATIAKYVAQGVRAVLITATGGEEGEYLNPAFAGADASELPRIRQDELAKSASIIGFAEVVKLGYRDSGMPGSEANARPEAFANRPLDEIVRPVVELLRRERPAVLISYGEHQVGYPHPDHLRVYDLAKEAVTRSGEESYAPELGEPFVVPKWYWSLWVRERFEKLAQALAEKGIEPPFRMTEREGDDELVTTRINVVDTLGVARDALRAHATQVDPNSPFWFALTAQEVGELYPWEDYHLVGSVAGVREDDLFQGVSEWLNG